jgi:hypothetical protein
MGRERRLELSSPARAKKRRWEGSVGEGGCQVESGWRAEAEGDDADESGNSVRLASAYTASYTF